VNLLFCKDPQNGNFGDDLNEVIWRSILPRDAFDAEDITLVGIGSIFSSKYAPIEKTRGRRVFVISSGAGYYPLPEGWQDWTILAVRGPLTARLIGRPDLSATDGAAFLATMPIPEGKRTLTLFMPHTDSLQFGRWDSICKAAGVTYVDPRWDVSRILELYSKARLVLAEAMHAAIVADTLRIPWIPIVASPHILSFKWMDWTLSLNLPYEPVQIPAPSLGDRVRSSKSYLSHLQRGYGAARIGSERLESTLIEDFTVRYSNNPMSRKRHSNNTAPLIKTVAKRGMRYVGRIVDPYLIEKTARAIQLAAEGRCYMSLDSMFAEKLDRLQSAKQTFLNAI
jgi:succinoglycan biosynthesis protein ExoV